MMKSGVSAIRYIAAVLFLLLVGCRAGDENNEAVESLMAMDPQSLDGEILKMPVELRADILISSWKRHPPSEFFNAPMLRGGLPLAKELKNRIQREGGYVTRVEFIDLMDQMRRAGVVSDADIQSLGIVDVCKGTGSGLCERRLQELLTPVAEFGR